MSVAGRVRRFFILHWWRIHWHRWGVRWTNRYPSQGEEQGIKCQLVQSNAQLRRLAVEDKVDTDRLADLNERARLGEQRLREIANEHERWKAERIDDCDVSAALAAFDPVWEHLCLKEQARVLQLLIEKVDYDGTDSTIAVTFRSTGFRTLAEETGEAAA